MITPEHLGADLEDIEDVLKKIEKSYNIAFEKNEFQNIKTFGAICDHIVSKINLPNTDDCTSQQAFYKLRDAIVKTKNIEREVIKLDSRLVDVFPKHNRRKQIADLETKLEFKLNVLQPHYFIIWVLIAALIGSIVFLFFRLEYALVGLATSLLLLFVVNKTGREFTINTVGEVAERMTQENYFKSRRNLAVMNKAEIPKEIEKIFLTYLVTDLKEITRDTLVI